MNYQGNSQPNYKGNIRQETRDHTGKLDKGPRSQSDI